jgi:hypothetical protein
MHPDLLQPVAIAWRPESGWNSAWRISGNMNPHPQSRWERSVSSWPRGVQADIGDAESMNSRLNSCATGCTGIEVGIRSRRYTGSEGYGCLGEWERKLS